MSLELQKMNEGIVSMDTKTLFLETNREIIPKTVDFRLGLRS